MKKFALILGLFLFLGGTARAEIYYGIDINEVYNTGDWNNKAEIKEIIDDYKFLLKLQKELDECANNIYTFPYFCAFMIKEYLKQWDLKGLGLSVT